MIRSCLNGWIHEFTDARSMTDNTGDKGKQFGVTAVGFKVLTEKPLASAEKKRAMKSTEKQRVPFISLSQCRPEWD